MISGKVRVSTVDEDHQEVIVDEPSERGVLRFRVDAQQTPHPTNAIAVEEAVCLEVSREDIAVLLQRKPMAGMDLLTRAWDGSSTRRNNWCACGLAGTRTDASAER